MLGKRLTLVLISLAILTASPAAVGRALSAPSPSIPFSMNFNGTLGQQVDLPGNRNALEVTGKLTLPSGVDVNTDPGTITVGDPDCPPQIQAPVNTLQICWPAQLTVEAEVSDEVNLTLRCPVQASADGEGFEIAGRCVIVVGTHEVSGKASLTGSAVLEPGGVINFALEGYGFCDSLDPKECPFI